jgi:hypothetical protein
MQVIRKTKMKLIALHSFRNPRNRIPGLPVHVARGTRFEVGSFATLKELERNDEKSAELVVKLLLAKCVAEYSPEVEAKLRAENAQDEKREANFKAVDARAATLGANSALADALQRLAALPEAAAPRAPARR